MSTAPSPFKAIARAATIVLALGAVGLTAMPAQAQSRPNASFSLELGNGQLQMHGGQRRGPGFGPNPDRGSYRPQVCLSDRDIYRGLRDYGYRVLDLGRERRGVIEVYAEQGRRTYAMDIERCTGWVSNIREIRSYGRPHRPGGGYGLQFHFSN